MNHQANNYRYLLKNIMVIDPLKKSSKKKDLYIRNGIITESFPNAKEIDAQGYYISPGFIDMHMHAFEGKTPLGINVDQVGIRQGVLTVVDAGSCGIRDFDSFEKDIIKEKSTYVKFFLNIAKQGLCDGLSELADVNQLITLDELKDFQKKHGNNLVGLKVRMSKSVVQENSINPLIYARKLSDETGLPIMVHIGNAPPALGDILNLLKKGDIITHVFHGKKGGICDYLEEFKNAVKRGVHFDVGHGTSSFSYQAMIEILKIENIDFSISTDIYNSNYEKPVGSLMKTMSKFLSSNFSVEEIVYKVTALPSKVLGIEYHDISVGAPANCTIFEICDRGAVELIDSEKMQIPSEKIFRPIMSIKKGKRVWEANV